MLELLERAEQLVGPAIRWVQFLNEVTGALCVTVGFVVAITSLFQAQVRHHTTSFTPIRLAFSRYLSLALEFQLASDILTTALKPSWQDLGSLAAVATIRTALNYFLSKEIDEYKKKMDFAKGSPPSPESAEA
jgi:uncharacterized membrane protein